MSKSGADTGLKNLEAALPTSRSKRVMIERNGQKLIAGYVSYNAFNHGWKFLPMFQASPSRKYWNTPEAALNGRVKNYTLEDVSSSDAGAKS